MKYENLYSVLSLFTQFLVVNLLFIIGIVCGLGIFGIGPSLIASHETFKRYHLNNEEVKVCSCFYRSYKKNFIRGNQLFIPVLIFLIFFQFDIQLLQKMGALKSIGLLIMTAIIQLLLMSWCSCLISMYIFYDMKITEYYRMAFLYICRNPLVLLLSLLWAGICIYGSIMIPGLIPVVSIGIWAFGNSAIFLRYFNRNEQLIKELANE